MISPNDFYQYYKKLANTELLNILNNPDSYEPAAIEAAKKEFSSRNLTDAEIDEAKELLTERNNEIERKNDNLKKIKSKLKPGITDIIEVLSPSYNAERSTEKNIRFIVIILAVLFLYQFINGYNSYIGYIKDIPKFPFESLSILMIQFSLPVAAFIFWRRKKTGWTLLIFLFTISSVFTILTLIVSYGFSPSGSNPLNNLFQLNSPYTLLIQSFFSIGMIYALCKKDLLKVFSIDNKKMKITLNVSVVIAILLFAFL